MRKTVPEKVGFVCVGIIQHAHGIKGEVSIRSLTEQPEHFNTYGTPVDDAGVPYVFSSVRVTQKGVLARLKGVEDRTQAEALKGTRLYVPLTALPEPSEGEAYLAELPNFTIVREDGTEFGRVSKVLDMPANAVLEVVLTSSAEADPHAKPVTVLLPYIADVILTVNRQAKTLTVSPMADEFVGL